MGQLLLRFTYLATDPEVARATGDIRRSLASDVYGTGAWTLFRPTQAALGQAVTCWRQGGAVADTVSLLAFRDMWRDGLGSQLGLEDEAEALREAHVVDDLPAETVVKLAVLQANLVGLLRLLEARLSTQDEKFTVGLGDQRRVSARLPLDRGT